MTRLYGDAVDDAAEVRRWADEPEQFLWRDRLYLVRAVLGHWMESGKWWRADVLDAGALNAEVLNDEVLNDEVLNDKEREFWRVEAGAGQLGDTGVFDLCFDWSHGRWTVVRVQD
jgi:hypothetical protein